MASENKQKIKLLKLVEMLRQETDELHPMLASRVCQRLLDMGITCNRRTLTKDIALLNENGFEVMSVMVGHEKGYYIDDLSFCVPELKILIDAVQAANFITKKKSDELIGKISALGGSYRAEILKSNMVCFNTKKHTNELIYYNVGFLEEAICSNKKVIFKYFDLDENCERVYRRDGHHYVTEPVALIYNEDNYYLIGYSAKHDNTVNYRVDRMALVEVIDETVCEKAIALRKSVSEYTDGVFKMYSGRLTAVTLMLSDKLIGVMYDKFGEGLKMERVDDSHCKATVHVQISPTFRGWLYQFGDEMKVVDPKDIFEDKNK